MKNLYLRLQSCLRILFGMLFTPDAKGILRHLNAMMGDIYFLKVDTLRISEQVLLKS